MNITVRFLNPEFDQLLDGQKIENIEFLDINHSFSTTNLVQTGLFVKQTAQNSTYLHPTSYHPKFIWSGILKGELTRVRRLCSNDTLFEQGVQEIIAKARRSEFSETTIKQALDAIKDWDGIKRLDLLKDRIKEKIDDSVVWVTQLPVCIKNTFKQKLKEQLPPEVNLRVTFQKPDSVRSMLFKPRALEAREGGCKPCGKCKLCGKHGTVRGRNMVQTTSKLVIGKDKCQIKYDLNCRSSGIYVAVCTQQGCKDSYVGKTVTSFSKRFNGHRGKWVGAGPSNKDDTALLDHYRYNHADTYRTWINDKKVVAGFDEAFLIYFVDRVGDNLTQQEDYWKNRLNSKINRCNIITPSITN